MESLIIAAVTGVVSSVATVAAVKADIAWLKQIQREIKDSLSSLDLRVVAIECKTKD